MPTTLEDIARALNVSKMTVSRAINNHPEISRDTRERILRTARKMNYRPNQFARALTTNHSYLIGIVVPDLMHSYFAEICRGVESRARPVGYQNLICSTDEEAAKELSEVEALLSRTDGLIVASAASTRELKAYRQLLKEGAKIVLIDRLLEGLHCPAVTTDDVKVGLLATEHLIELGHRQVGFLRGADVSTSTKREEGYRQALTKHRLRIEGRLMRDCGFTESDGYNAMSVWLKEGGVPPAVFAANDPAAIGAMAAINEAGLTIPQDLAIVGVGNIHYGDMLQVPLTTVSWSKMLMGQAAAELLLKMIDGKSVKKSLVTVVEPELIVRRSCGG
ncbi:MAG TPA: LacI family DNA-binding transcriptional regulator [Pyrinomonadaceae bacterium]|nr:LacI family DNA-binding transcriptional regulator [Pyrinomonadaceae bacterium]